MQYKKNQEVIKAEIRIIGELPNDDIYDFVLLTVRENQLYEALTELKNNKSNAYYESDDPEKVEKEWKMNIFRFLPLPFLVIMLAVTFGSSFGEKFMYQHAMKAPDEMRELHKQFYAYMKKMKKCGCKAKKKNIPNTTFVVGDCENFPFEKDSFDAIICSMSFHHYPDPQAFFDSVKRCLRPNGRLILRDVTSDNKVLVWLMNTLEMPLANICGHGDVQVPTRDVVIKCCKKAGLKVEKFEIRKGMRMHCVVRKPMGKAIENER